jgi:hypothetical protein
MSIMNQRSEVFYNPKDPRILIDKRNAYHQAGRAVAIYVGNKQRQLPDVYFQIVIKPLSHNGHHPYQLRNKHCKYTAYVEGGRLIQSLPLSYIEATQYFSWPQQEEYLCAFEADVINLLAGSIAEAKYLATCDCEDFNPHLINLSALHFYGGSSDIDVIYEYMESFIVHQAERERKLAELFMAAFNFVNEKSNWLAISVLAQCILDKSKSIFNCEDVISLLDSSLVDS